MAYDLAWLAKATFEDLDAAMNNITIRREVEPLLRTKQGEAMARKLVETRGAAKSSSGQYGIEWLRTATYDDLKKALTDINARPQVEMILRTVEGAQIASQLINDTRVVPPADEPVSDEEQAQIDADNQRADEQAVSDEAQPVTEAPVVVEPKNTVEAPKVKIVRDYQVEDEQGKPLGRRTHIEGWSPEEIYAKYEAAHTNAVRYAERLKKRLDTFDQASRATESATKAQLEANEAIAVAKKENDPVKFSEAVDKTSVAKRQKEAADKATAQYYSIIIDSWMEDHKDDFVPCEASSELLNAWLLANNKPYSYENLEAAFQATKHKQPVPERRAVVSAAPVNNPQAVAAVSPATQAAPITQPEAAQTVQQTQATPTANPQASAQASQTTSGKAAQSAQPRRAGVNGGLQPSSASARPVKNATQTSAATERATLMQEIRSMSPGQYRDKVAKSEEFRTRLKAAGIIDAGVR